MSENLRKIVVRNLPFDTTEESFLAKLDAKLRAAVDYTTFSKGKPVNKLKGHDAVPAFIVVHLSSKPLIEQLCRQFDGQPFSEHYPTQLVSIEYAPQQRASWGQRMDARKYTNTIEDDAMFKRFLEAEAAPAPAVDAAAAEPPKPVSTLVADVVKYYYSSRGGRAGKIDVFARDTRGKKKDRKKDKGKERDRSSSKDKRAKKDKRNRKDDKRRDGEAKPSTGKDKSSDRKDKKDRRERKDRKKSSEPGAKGDGKSSIPRPRSEQQAGATTSTSAGGASKFTVSNTRVMKRPQP
jgi:hypothetical protein